MKTLVHFVLNCDIDWLQVSWIVLSCTFKAIFLIDSLDDSFFRGEWSSGLRYGSKNQKVPISNPTRGSAGLRDPTSLQGSWWPPGQKCKMQWLKELWNYIPCIIHVWSLFCSIWVYKGLYFLLILLENYFFSLSELFVFSACSVSNSI